MARKIPKRERTRLIWQTDSGKTTHVIYGDEESLYAVIELLHCFPSITHCILYIDNKPTEGFGSFQL